MKMMIKRGVFLFNILAVAALLFVHYTASINPLSFWPTAFLGLVYPLLLILVIGFLIYYLFSKNKKLAFFSAMALALSFKSNQASLNFSFSSQQDDEASIMTWNVKNFDLYNWSGNEDTRDNIMVFLEENRPNILCLQEFYTEDKGSFTNLEDIQKNLAYKYVYFAKTYSQNEQNHWGLAIFSDFEIIDQGKLSFVEGTRLNSCMYADLALNDEQSIRLYNLHLQSNQFSKEDYDYLQHLGDNENDSQSAKNIFSKLKKGYLNRAKQSLQVLENKNQSPYPSIICGDFNDTPVSFAYKELSRNMKDAFVEKGSGFSKTFVNPSPFLRIDYALFDPTFEINKYTSLKVELSDHYPVLVNFSY